MEGAVEKYLDWATGPPEKEWVVKLTSHGWPELPKQTIKQARGEAIAEPERTKLKVVQLRKCLEGEQWEKIDKSMAAILGPLTDQGVT